MITQPVHTLMRSNSVGAVEFRQVRINMQYSVSCLWLLSIWYVISPSHLHLATNRILFFISTVHDRTWCSARPPSWAPRTMKNQVLVRLLFVRLFFLVFCSLFVCAVIVVSMLMRFPASLLAIFILSLFVCFSSLRQRWWSWWWGYSEDEQLHESVHDGLHEEVRTMYSTYCVCNLRLCFLRAVPVYFPSPYHRSFFFILIVLYLSLVESNQEDDGAIFF